MINNFAFMAVEIDSTDVNEGCSVPKEGTRKYIELKN